MNALTLFNSFFFKLNLSPFLLIPPNNHKILEFAFKILRVEEKLVDFESLIIVKPFFLKLFVDDILNP